MMDGWTSREKLYLASAVMKSGENNWASVSKLMRNMHENNRPTEFFSQKNCAQQFTALVEALAPPRRKRTDTAATSISSEPSFSASQVVEKLKQERMEELKREVQQDLAQSRKMQKEIEMIRSGQLDHQLQFMLEQRLMEKPSLASAASIPTAATEEPEEAQPAGEVETFVVSAATSPVKTAEHEQVETVKSPKITASPTKQPEAAELPVVFSPKTPQPQQPEMKPTVISSPKTPSTLYQPLEFSSPSKPPPSFLVIRSSSPLVSPSNSPSTSFTAIQGALLSPATSVSHSPPRPIENQALQLILQKMRSPSPATSPTKAESVNAPSEAILKEMTETIPVVELEKLPPAQVAAAAAAFEDSDSDEEEKPLAQFQKTPPAAASPPKPTEIASPALPPPPPPPPSVEPTEPPKEPEPKKPEETVQSPPRVEPLKIKVDKSEKIKSPPKRIMPVRGKATTAQRRKRNSGGSSASSEASSTVRAAAATSTSSRSPLPVPAPFPDNETYKQWKKMILNVWNMAAGHRHASLFLQPVRDSIAPGYSKFIKKPVDLSTIKKGIENGALTSTEEVKLYLLMMFANAVMYNASNTEVNQMARDMANDVMKHLDDLLVPINAMFSGGGIEATKSLRSNRHRQTAIVQPPPEVITRRSLKRPRINSDEDTPEKPISKRQK